MDKIHTFILNNLDDTEKLAKVFAENLDTSGSMRSGSVFSEKSGFAGFSENKAHSCLICLYGDIGSGKTTFVKFLAKYLGIKEKVTSPSFVILNEYRSEKVNLYHFDLYRLEKEGVETILEELTEYTHKKNSVTIIEWAEFSTESLPEKRIEIEIKYLGETRREFRIKGWKNKIFRI